MSRELGQYLGRNTTSGMPPPDERSIGGKTSYWNSREQISQKADNINKKLNDIEDTLNETTSKINEEDKTAASTKENAGIERVLNTYYDTLKWIESSTSDTNEQLKSIETVYGRIMKY